MYPLLGKFGMKVIGSWSTVIGNTNEVTVLCAVEDMGQQQKAAMAMMQDKEYQAVTQKMLAFVVAKLGK